MVFAQSDEPRVRSFKSEAFQPDVQRPVREDLPRVKCGEEVSGEAI